MKQLIKKMFTFILAWNIIICFSGFGNAIAANNPLDTYFNQILEEVADMIDVSSDLAQIIELNSELPATRGNSATGQKAIRFDIQKQNEPTVTRTVIPYIVVNDELINSFDFAQASVQARNISQLVNLVDLSVIVDAYYGIQVTSPPVTEFIGELYRPESLYVQWISNRSDVSVDDIYAQFWAYGYLWEFSYTPQDLHQLKEANFEVYKTNPVEGQSYGDWAAAFPSNRGLYCPDINMGGILRYSINYRVGNANPQYDTYSWTLWGFPL